MNHSDIDVQELADRYESNPDETLPEIADILKELNLQDPDPDDPSKQRDQLMTQLISECVNRNSEHFRDNFNKYISGDQDEWLFDSV